MEKIMKAFLIEKFGEEVYNSHQFWLSCSSEKLDTISNNFTFDYPGAFTDFDFLYDVRVWKRLENQYLGD